LPTLAIRASSSAQPASTSSSGTAIGARTLKGGPSSASTQTEPSPARTIPGRNIGKCSAAAERGEFDILLVDDLSRLARDQVECERVIRRLEFRGIRIVTTADGYDSQTRTATRKIQRTVKGDAARADMCGMPKARLALRELLGQIRLEPGDNGSLWAA
jgi:hypothetical protein